MGKKKKAESHDSIPESLQRMPIASAMQQNDTSAMQRILLKALPNARQVEDVSIEKSQGESFTGGRSTPVYLISCTVRKPRHAIRRHFVVKLVVMPDDDEKTAIRRESYAVERRFYGSDAIQERLQKAALTIPKLLASDLDGSKPWPCFCILMNDLSVQYPLHPKSMSVDQAVCSLHWIATFHATFWGEQYATVLWERGGFWTKACHVNGIATTWVQTAQFIESKYPSYSTPHTKGLGHRIQNAGHAIFNFLSDQTRHRTVIHGDYKAANLFFSTKAAAAVDFQFTGGGVGAEDVAYLLYPDAFGDWFAHEDMLLKTYHETLVSQLILQRKGGPSTLPFDMFLKFYDLARLDMTRHWLYKGWIASTEGEAKLVGALERALDGMDGGSLLSGDEYKEAVHRFVFGV